MSITRKLEWAAAFVLPVYAVYEITSLAFQSPNHVHKLVVPFVVCCVAIAKIQYDWWVGVIFMTIADTKFIMYLSLMNSVALGSLFTLIPHTICSFAISMYFQYHMIKVIDEVLQRCFEALASPIQFVVKPQLKHHSTWRVIHECDEKCDDVCLICLDHLNNSEYVYLCLHVRGDRVNVQFRISNVVLQCNTCGCVLHANCHLACNGKCPICQ